MTALQFEAHHEDDTERLGIALAEVLPPGTVVALNGTLGAGKTRLVQAIGVALGVERLDVVSPTFVLMHQYAGRRPVYHIDAYRIGDDDEFLELGFDELLDGPGLIFIEWAERVARCLPLERIEIQIEVVDSNQRRFEITAGPGLEAVMRQLDEKLRGSGVDE